MHPWVLSGLGGMLIGLAASLMLFFNGRVTGISGIYNGLLSESGKEWLWRLAFILGLLSGGFLMNFIKPEFFISTLSTPTSILALAGFIVGFGTALGSGCTSGHGVCGLSRFSIRSLVATLSFMFSGFVTVTLLRMMGKGG